MFGLYGTLKLFSFLFCIPLVAFLIKLFASAPCRFDACIADGERFVEVGDFAGTFDSSFTSRSGPAISCEGAVGGANCDWASGMCSCDSLPQNSLNAGLVRPSSSLESES
ncbi:hypothetical protein V7S43_014670 [Phytophthora oleae]|uniref:Secreted protein n=1 Tax=Phytophthora oleae TaxID=2107226 RepID=A0ABD3F282_9STRA